MSGYPTLADLTDSSRGAVIDLLYRMADDEIVLGHRDSEWTGHGPILEEDIAFSSMSQDEMGHALMYYQMLHELGEADADTLAFGRKAEQYRCSSLVSLPNNRDWAFCVMRQFLYDAAETVRLAALAEGSLVPLAQLARKLRGEEKYHLMHGRMWIVHLGKGTDESRGKMQAALDFAFPHALGLFEPTDADATLADAAICPKESELCAQWQAAVGPVLAEAGLTMPENAKPAYGGRSGRHHESLSKLLEDMQLVYNIDPTAKW